MNCHFAWMYVSAVSTDDREGVESPRSGVANGCKAKCGYLELSQGPVKSGQCSYVLTEPPLQPLFYFETKTHRARLESNFTCRWRWPWTSGFPAGAFECWQSGVCYHPQLAMLRAEARQALSWVTPQAQDMSFVCFVFYIKSKHKWKSFKEAWNNL